MLLSPNNPRYRVCRFGYAKPFKIDFKKEMINICANYLNSYEDYRAAMFEALIYMHDYYENDHEQLNLAQSVCSYIRFKNILGQGLR